MAFWMQISWLCDFFEVTVVAFSSITHVQLQKKKKKKGRSKASLSSYENNKEKYVQPFTKIK